MEYKTFDDLVFKDDEYVEGMYRARLWFPNNYGISVIKGYGAYGNIRAPYECAVLWRESRRSRQFELVEMSGEWGNNVKGWCTEDDVTDIMKQIQDKQ